MLPYGPRSFPGYRLLTEYFTFPHKFLFFDVTGLECLSRTPAQDKIELLLFLESQCEPTRESRQDRLVSPGLHADRQSVHAIGRADSPDAHQDAVSGRARRPPAASDGGLIRSTKSKASIPTRRRSITYQPFYSLQDKTEAEAMRPFGIIAASRRRS